MNTDLTVGKPDKVLRKFCLPLFASIIFQQLYNIADSFVAGKYVGEVALASVGNSYEITLIFLAFAVGCNVGCSVIVSRLFGAKEYRNMKTAIYTTLISSGVVCLLLMLIGLVFGNILLDLIHTPQNIFADSKLYLDIYCLGLPFVFYYNVATGIFSALGDSKTPFIFLAFSSTANILADILFVTAFRMGVAGVAWATFICQGVSCVLAMIVVLKRVKKIECNKKSKVFSVKIFRDIATVAIPTILQQSFVSVGNVFVQSVINTFGAGVIAGYSASIKLNSLVVTSFVSISNGISSYTSQNLGAEKIERIKEGFKAGIKLVVLIAVPFTIVYFFFGKLLLNWFIDNPSETAIKTGVIFLRILSPFYAVISFKIVTDGLLKGSSKMLPFMCSTFADLFVRVVLAFILSKQIGSVGIWISWPLGWLTSTTMSVIFYKKAKFVNTLKS